MDGGRVDTVHWTGYPVTRRVDHPAHLAQPIKAGCTALMPLITRQHLSGRLTRIVSLPSPLLAVPMQCCEIRRVLDSWWLLPQPGRHWHSTTAPAPLPVPALPVCRHPSTLGTTAPCTAALHRLSTPHLPQTCNRLMLFPNALHHDLAYFHCSDQF